MVILLTWGFDSFIHGIMDGELVFDHERGIIQSKEFAIG